MGIIDDFKKLVFGAKSVSKSTAEKVIKKGKDTGDKIVDESGEIWGKAKKKASDVGDEIVEKSDEVWEKAMDSTEDFRKKVKEKTEDTMDVAEDVGKIILDKGSVLANKAKDLAEDIGSKIIEKGSNLKKKHDDTLDDLKNDFRDIRDEEDEEDEETYVNTIEDLFEEEKTELDPDVEDTDVQENDLFDSDDSPGNAGDFVDDIDLKGEEKESDMVDKAKAVADKMSDVLDDTIEKAKQMADEEMKPRKAVGTPTENLKKDLLDNDDFFRKANAFAEGRYKDVHDPEPEGGTTINRDPDYKKEKKKDSGMLPGFEDLDGDGNELIDDALLLKDEEE